MGKTYRDMGKPGRKPKRPRGPFRPNWDIPHSSDRDYNRRNFKKETEELVEDEISPPPDQIED